MPDQPEPSPAQEAEVRRLLADARHTEPMPAEVAERLDRVLAGLAAEPAREARVVRLADRRRRAASLLVAAAAVVVAGVGIGQVVGGEGGSEDLQSAEVADDGPAEEEAAPPEAAAGGGDSDGAVSELQAGSVPARVRPDRFAEDVGRLRQVPARSAYAQDRQDAEEPGDTGARDAARAWCEPGAWGRGTYRPVRYGNAEGWVVLRRPQGDTQVADLFLCGSELTVRSVTLSSP